MKRMKWTLLTMLWEGREVGSGKVKKGKGVKREEKMKIMKAKTGINDRIRLTYNRIK